MLILAAFSSCKTQFNSISRKNDIPNQYIGYYNYDRCLLANKEFKTDILRLPVNIGNEILTSYLNNNLDYFTDTTNVDETYAIFNLTISPKGKVTSIKVESGNIPLDAVRNLCNQFFNITFEKYHRTTQIYLPIYLEIPYGNEISIRDGKFNGYVYNDVKPYYIVWTCYNPIDKGIKFHFKGYHNN